MTTIDSKVTIYNFWGRPVTCFLLLFVFVACSSCRDPNSDQFIGAPKPDNLIQRETFTNLMLQIHYHESLVANMNLPKDTAGMFFKVLKDSILNEFGEDTSSLRASYVYYSKNPKTMEMIYQVISDSLNLRKSRLEMEKKKQQEEDE